MYISLRILITESDKVRTAAVYIYRRIPVYIKEICFNIIAVFKQFPLGAFFLSFQNQENNSRNQKRQSYHSKDDKEKAYLLNYFLEQFRSTLFRQTMFAEFEKLAHAKSEAGETLTAEVLCDMYYDLNKKYFGNEIVVDKEIALEWSRIPHFYTPFYVYQYSTGFSAAIAISSKILKGEPGIVEKYKKFLSSGSSLYCIDLLKICDVDMTTKEPVEEALKMVENTLEEFAKII